MKRILVIKLSALGDFIQATAPLKAIREHHKGDHITLLTTKGMLSLAEDCPWIDAISIDERKSLFNIPYILDMRRKLHGFDMVYDLQTNDRTGSYFWLAGRPEWSGIARGCSLPHKNPQRNFMHSLDRLQDQLRDAGISYNHLPDLSFAAADVSGLFKENNLKKGKFTVLIAGAAPSRPAKRWPHYTELAKILISKGETVVLIGGPAEKDLNAGISEKTGAINLTGKTSLNELIGVLQEAKQFIGNDTGPSHMAAALGTKGTVLFGHDSDPKLHSPRGDIQVIQKPNIKDITPEEVLACL